MKKLLFLLFVFMFSIINYAQVILSPYLVYTDQHNRYGSFLVQNESNKPYEISISFTFGFPVTDSLGKMTMKYIENPLPEDPSILPWIRAFPKKFILNPSQRQTVRLAVKPDKRLSPGTYWARIVTSAAPKSTPIDTVQKGISAQLKFVLNQVTTLFYRVDTATTGVRFDTAAIRLDSSDVLIHTKVSRIGNSPFLGDLNLAIKDSLGNTVYKKNEYLPLYYSLAYDMKVEKKKFNKGKYSVELSAVLKEKEDIPQGKIKRILPLKEKLIFTIP